MDDEEWTKQANEFREFVSLRVMRTREQSGADGGGGVELVDADAETAVSYNILSEFYGGNPEFEQVVPLSAFEQCFRDRSGNSAPFGELMEIAEDFCQVHADVERLFELSGGHSTIRWGKFVQFAAELLRSAEAGIRREIREKSSHLDEDEQEEQLDEWRRSVWAYIRFELLHESYGQLHARPQQDNKVLISLSEIIASKVLDNLRNTNESGWVSYDTFLVFRSCYEFIISPKSRKIESADAFETSYSLSPKIPVFTPAFISALWSHLERIGWVQEGRLGFAEYLQIRRLLFFTEHTKSRRFLFDVLDVDGDGFIGLPEFRRFYSSLRSLYLERQPGELFPTPTQAFISWFDQIRPNIAPHILSKGSGRLEAEMQRVKFDDIAHHAFGGDFLGALISPEGFDRVDFRFEDSVAFDADTECDPEEGTAITTEQLDSILGLPIEDDDLANRRDFLHIDED